MSKMSDISIEIQGRLADDEEPNIIANVMDIPISWVYADLESMYFSENDYDPNSAD